MMAEYSKSNMSKSENILLTAREMQGLGGLLKAWVVSPQRLFGRFKLGAGLWKTDS